jgi:hypothetical protein
MITSYEFAWFIICGTEKTSDMKVFVAAGSNVALKQRDYVKKVKRFE